jgi:glycosyltransferase involved in cell wall biosynthesis
VNNAQVFKTSVTTKVIYAALARKYDVHVLTTGSGDVERGEFTVHRLIPPVKGSLPFDIHNNELFYRKAEKTLAGFVKDEKFDVVHAFNMFSIPPCASVAKKKGRPVVATVNDHWGTCFFRSHFHEGKVVEVCTNSILKRNIKREGISPLATPYIIHAMKYRKKAMQKCDRLIAVSNPVKNILEKNGFKDVSVIHNPVDLEAFKPEHFRGTGNMLFIGRLDFGKGIETLIRAAALARNDVKFNLVFAGTGDEDRYKQMVREYKVTAEFLGKMEHGDIPGVIHDSDIVVVPFERVEAFPRAVSEAFACGRAVITTDIAGGVDIVKDGKSGMLVPPRDPEALARIITLLMPDKEKLAAMGIEGRRIVEERLNSDMLLGKLIQVYETILNGRNS